MITHTLMLFYYYIWKFSLFSSQKQHVNRYSDFCYMYTIFFWNSSMFYRTGVHTCMKTVLFHVPCCAVHTCVKTVLFHVSCCAVHTCMNAVLFHVPCCTVHTCMNTVLFHVPCCAVHTCMNTVLFHVSCCTVHTCIKTVLFMLHVLSCPLAAVTLTSPKGSSSWALDTMCPVL